MFFKGFDLNCLKIWTNVYIAVTSVLKTHDVRILMVHTDVSVTTDLHPKMTTELAMVRDETEFSSVQNNLHLTVGLLKAFLDFEQLCHNSQNC